MILLVPAKDEWFNRLGVFWQNWAEGKGVLYGEKILVLSCRNKVDLEVYHWEGPLF